MLVFHGNETLERLSVEIEGLVRATLLQRDVRQGGADFRCRAPVLGVECTLQRGGQRKMRILEPSLERQDFARELVQPCAIRVCEVLEGNAFEQSEDFHVPLADQPTTLVGQQVDRILDFIARDEVVNVLHELFGGGVVLGVPRDAATVKVLTLLLVEASQKEFADEIVHVKRVAVRLPSQALIDQRVKHVEIKVLLTEGVKRHGFPKHGQGGENALFLRAKLGENLHRHIGLKRLVVCAR